MNNDNDNDNNTTVGWRRVKYEVPDRPFVEFFE